MATLRNKWKLSAVTRETQEEHPENGQSWNTSVPRINEDYITQVSQEIEGTVIKKLSQNFSRPESRISGALSKLDEFFLNPQIGTHSGTVPGTSHNCSENLLEHRRRKPWTNWGSFPELSLSWSGTLSQCVPRISWFSPRRGFPNEDRSSKINLQLSPWDFFRKTKEGTLHKSVTIPQWEHPSVITLEAPSKQHLGNAVAYLNEKIRTSQFILQILQSKQMGMGFLPSWSFYMHCLSYTQSQFIAQKMKLTISASMFANYFSKLTNPP